MERKENFSHFMSEKYGKDFDISRISEQEYFLTELELSMFPSSVEKAELYLSRVLD